VPGARLGEQDRRSHGRADRDRRGCEDRARRHQADRAGEAIDRALDREREAALPHGGNIPDVRGW
jgi:hypothetical protein